MQQALRHHRAGQFNEAERIYLQALDIDQHQPDAVHLHGMIAYQTGRDEAAVELICRARNRKRS